MKKNIKTFRILLIKDNMEINELAQLVKTNGTLYRNRWRAWEASLPRNAKTKDGIDAALNVLADFASAVNQGMEYWFEELDDFSIHHPLDNFGFTIGENNELFVEKTAVQTLEDQLENLKEEIKRLGGVYEPQVNEELVAPELELANQLYRDALKKHDANTNKVEGKTPREWIKSELSKMNLDLEDAAILRIATVANWDKKQINKSKK